MVLPADVTVGEGFIIGVFGAEVANTMRAILLMLVDLFGVDGEVSRLKYHFASIHRNIPLTGDVRWNMFIHVVIPFIPDHAMEFIANA